MLNELLKLYFRLTGKHHLIPFIDGLANVGRPSQVFFPMELVEQGLGLLLSGLNNTLTIQSNLDWIWPYWLEQQQNPETKEFIPTGVNLITANLSLRNWTSIGNPDSVREGMLDQVGMLTLEPYGCSMMPYLRARGESKLAKEQGEKEGFFPPRLQGKVRQSLFRSTLPSVITEYEIAPYLHWSSETTALQCDGEDLVWFSHSLRNLSSEPLPLTFGLAIRPYNPLTIGHINHLRFKNNLWRVNHRPAFLFLENPDHTSISDRHSGDPLLLKRWQVASEQVSSSKSGILSGISEWDIQLEPGEHRTFVTLGTLGKQGVFPNRKFKTLTKDSVFIQHNTTLESLEKTPLRGMQVKLPEMPIEIAFNAIRNRIHVFDDVTHFSPGTFFYHHNWIRDSAFIAMAFDNLGLFPEVVKKIPGYMQLQTRSGFFRSQNGEWDSNGQALFTIVRHARCSGNHRLLSESFDSLMLGAKWIDNMRRQEMKRGGKQIGLLPAGFSAEHFGPNDHYYWDNFWSLAGIREVLWTAEFLGKHKNAEWLRNCLHRYEEDLKKSIDIAFSKCDSIGLPCSPYRSLDSAAIGNLVALVPLNLFDTNEYWVKPTIDYLWNNNILDGLFFQKIIHTGLNPYLSVQLAKAMMASNDDRWESILYAMLRFASPTYTWPEAIHPKTRGGCMGDGDHGWAAAEFLCLIREMLLRESTSTLWLAPAVPETWFKTGMVLEVKNAPSLGGTVSYSLRYNQYTFEIRWSIHRNALHQTLPVYIVLPYSCGIHRNQLLPHTEKRGKILIAENEGYLVFYRDSRKNEFAVRATQQSISEAVLANVSQGE